MVRKVISRRFALPDLLIVLLVATAIYGVVSTRPLAIIDPVNEGINK